jgi:hypothetical protein
LPTVVGVSTACTWIVDTADALPSGLLTVTTMLRSAVFGVPEVFVPRQHQWHRFEVVI